MAQLNEIHPPELTVFDSQPINTSIVRGWDETNTTVSSLGEVNLSEIRFIVQPSKTAWTSLYETWFHFTHFIGVASGVAQRDSKIGTVDYPFASVFASLSLLLNDQRVTTLGKCPEIRLVE